MAGPFSGLEIIPQRLTKTYFLAVFGLADLLRAVFGRDLPPS